MSPSLVYVGTVGWLRNPVGHDCRRRGPGGRRVILMANHRIGVADRAAADKAAAWRSP